MTIESQYSGEQAPSNLVRTMALSSAELWHEVLQRLEQVQQSQNALARSIEDLGNILRQALPSLEATATVANQISTFPGNAPPLISEATGAIGASYDMPDLPPFSLDPTFPTAPLAPEPTFQEPIAFDPTFPTAPLAPEPVPTAESLGAPGEAHPEIPEPLFFVPPLLESAPLSSVENLDAAPTFIAAETEQWPQAPAGNLQGASLALDALLGSSAPASPAFPNVGGYDPTFSAANDQPTYEPTAALTLPPPPPPMPIGVANPGVPNFSGAPIANTPDLLDSLLGSEFGPAPAAMTFNPVGQASSPLTGVAPSNLPGQIPGQAAGYQGAAQNQGFQVNPDSLMGDTGRRGSGAGEQTSTIPNGAHVGSSPYGAPAAAPAGPGYGQYQQATGAPGGSDAYLSTAAMVTDILAATPAMSAPGTMAMHAGDPLDPGVPIADELTIGKHRHRWFRLRR